MNRLTKEERLQLKKFIKNNKGAFFSPDGICTLRRYWLSLLFVNYPIKLLFAFIQVPTYIFEVMNYDITALYGWVMNFWIIIIQGLIIYYFSLLDIKRFRSIKLNPWLVLIPFFNFFVSHFIPLNKNIYRCDNLNNKINHKNLLIFFLVLKAVVLSIGIFLILFLGYFTE